MELDLIWNRSDQSRNGQEQAIKEIEQRNREQYELEMNRDDNL